MLDDLVYECLYVQPLMHKIKSEKQILDGPREREGGGRIWRDDEGRQKEKSSREEERERETFLLSVLVWN